MIPDLLVGIELRGIRWQGRHHDAVGLTVDEGLSLFAVMVMGVVGDRDDGSSGIFTQLLQELDEARRVYALFDKAKAHTSPESDGADDFQPKAPTAVAYHRGTAIFPQVKRR